MRTVVSELTQRFDIVLLDSPPVLPVADAMILSGYADAVVLVVAAGQTRRAELRRTTEKLAQANAPVVGVALNKAASQDGYGYYGGYRSYTALPASPPAESAKQAHNGRDNNKQNGSPVPSGQQGRHGR